MQSYKINMNMRARIKNNYSYSLKTNFFCLRKKIFRFLLNLFVFGASKSQKQDNKQDNKKNRITNKKKKGLNYEEDYFNSSSRHDDGRQFCRDKQSQCSKKC